MRRRRRRWWQLPRGRAARAPARDRRAVSASNLPAAAAAAAATAAATAAAARPAGAAAASGALPPRRRGTTAPLRRGHRARQTAAAVATTRQAALPQTHLRRSPARVQRSLRCEQLRRRERAAAPAVTPGRGRAVCRRRRRRGARQLRGAQSALAPCCGLIPDFASKKLAMAEHQCCVAELAAQHAGHGGVPRVVHARGCPARADFAAVRRNQRNGCTR
jgi:hypothetical protein